MHARSIANKFDSRPFALGLVCLIASGCAAGISNQPHGRAAGQWSVTLPTAASYSQGLAYGKGGSSLPETWVDVDDIVQPMVAEAHPQRISTEDVKRKPVRKHRAEEQQPATTAPQPETTPVSAPASRNERTELALADTTQPTQADSNVLSRYEERQSKAQEQQKFRGGDAIIIGASTLVIVLVVVLLLVLLL